MFYNIYYTIFKTSHYIRDGVLGVLAQYFNILLSCELTKKTSCTCASNFFWASFCKSKVVIGGKYIFVLITVLHAWPIALISTSVSQKITLNNVQNRRVLVLVVALVVFFCISFCHIYRFSIHRLKFLVDIRFIWLWMSYTIWITVRQRQCRLYFISVFLAKTTLTYDALFYK